MGTSTTDQDRPASSQTVHPTVSRPAGGRHAFAVPAVAAPPVSAPVIPAPAQRGTGPTSWISGPVSTDVADPPGRRAEPRLRQLIGVCAWAAVLGGVGLVIGIRGLIGLMVASVPRWFEPTMTVVGVTGIALTVGAFLTVQRPRTPWILLGSSSATLVLAMVLTAVAF